MRGGVHKDPRSSVFHWAGGEVHGEERDPTCNGGFILYMCLQDEGGFDSIKRMRDLKKML